MPRADSPVRSGPVSIVTIAPHASSGPDSVRHLSGRDNDSKTKRSTPEFRGQVIARSNGNYFQFLET